VAAVDRPPRRAEAAQADPVDAERVVVELLHLDSERTDGGDRRLGVRRAAEAANERLALGDRAEQDGPVRGRLVARDGDVAPGGAGRCDDGAHVSISGATSTP